jgi:PAS domain S-box-containing protein
MFRNRPIVFHLAALVLCAMIPLLGVIAYVVYDRMLTDMERTTAEVAGVAASTADETEQLLLHARRLLSLLAARPQVRALDPSRCDHLLVEMHGYLPQLTNLATFDVSGHPVCTALAPGATAPEDGPVYDMPAVAARQFAIATPAIGHTSKKWIASLELPLLDASGGVSGVVGIALDLAKFSQFRYANSLPSAGVIAIVDENHEVIARSVQPEKWIGRQMPAFQLHHVFDSEQGVKRVLDGDGVERICGFRRVAGTNWYATASIPVEDVLAPAVHNAKISITLVLAAAALAAALCAILARRISVPVKFIAEATRQAGAGNLELRIEPGGPREIAGVAAEFNRMLANRRQAESALHDREEYFRTLLAELHIGVLVQNSAAAIVSSNRSALELLGLSDEQILGKTSFDPEWNVVREDGTPFPASQHPVPQSIATGRPVRNVVMGVYRPATRERIWLEVNAIPLFDADNAVKQVICTFSDLTERRLSQQRRRDYAGQLQSLLRRLMELQEQERRYLGRELHDRIGTNLSALLLSLGILRTRMSPESMQELGPRISDLETLLRETIVHVKDVLADVHPPALSELGLMAALSHYVRSLATRSGLRIEIEGKEPTPRLPEFVEIALFRIAQEALNNASKHARASVILVSVNIAAGQLVLTVADDGAGFDSASLPPDASGIGLPTMRERALAISAKLAIVTAVGEGTSVVVKLQVPAAPVVHP